MTQKRAVIIRSVENRVRITSFAQPRFCVEAETREDAVKLALEAIRYLDSVADEVYVAPKADYEVELLCA